MNAILCGPETSMPANARDTVEHPATTLRVAHRSDLRSTRASLLRDLRGISRPLARVAARVMRQRDLLTPPAIGELWPWLIGDLASLPSAEVQKVSKAWLAIYLYTLLLDKQCDEPSDSPNPTDALTGALLFEYGLGDFLVMTAGTKWQATVRDAVRCSLRDQELDVRMAARVDDPVCKRQTAAGKNAGFLMCTAALSALTQIDKPVLDEFAKSVLLAFQHLDDIADYDDDWRRGNFTPLLIAARGHLANLDPTVSAKSLILEGLVISGALRDILSETKTSVECALQRLSSTSPTAISPNAPPFFSHLITALEEAIGGIDRSARLLKESQDDECRRLLLEGIDQRLRIVAQQS